jgi:hypothetical protein
MTLSFEQQQFLKEQSGPDLFQHRRLAERGYLLALRRKASPEGRPLAPPTTGGWPESKQPHPGSHQAAPAGADRVAALTREARYAFGLPARVVYFARAEALFATEGARARLVAEARALSGFTDGTDRELLDRLVDIAASEEKSLEWLRWIESRDAAGVYREEPVTQRRQALN